MVCTIYTTYYEQQIVNKMLIFLIVEKVAYYKQLEGGVFFIEEIPKSPSGKILRRKLKEMAVDTQSKL